MGTQEIRVTEKHGLLSPASQREKIHGVDLHVKWGKAE